MIKIRNVEDKDLVPLSKILSKVFPFFTQKNWLSVFAYWWSTNPSYSDQITRGWLVEKDEVIVGFLGNIPVNIMVHGEVKLAVAANSWYLDPAIRGIYSISMFNEFMKQKNIQVFLYKSGDDSFIEFLSRYHFKEYILPKFQRDFIYIIDKKKMNITLIKFILYNKLNLKFQGRSELPRRLGLLMGSWIFQKSLVPGTDEPREEYLSSLCTSCDCSFLSIRRSNQRNNNTEIIYDVKTLNWLWFSQVETRKRVVIQCKRSSNNSLVGYAVFDIQNDPPFKGIIQLMDMCIENENLQVLKSIISYIIEIGKQNNINLLTLWANCPIFEDYFRSTIILKRSVQSYRYVRFSDSDEISFLTNDCGNIYSSLIFPPQ